MNRRGTRSKLNHERWLVSYADFITLLFAFFVVLYAFASADRKKQMQVSAAITSALQSLSIAPAKPSKVSKTATLPHPALSAPALIALDPVSAKGVQADLERIRQDLRSRLSTEIAQGTVSIDLGRDGLVISLHEAGFFDSGTAIPRPETTATLGRIGQSLAGTPYEVRVEGHTDTIPIHNANFDSNWELSTARATRIARILLEMRTIAPERLSASGYAEYHPLASNDTSEGRATNRRVDLVVMPRTFLPVSSPDGAEHRTGWRKITDQ